MESGVRTARCNGGLLHIRRTRSEGRERRTTAMATGHGISSVVNQHTRTHTRARARTRTGARTKTQVGPASYVLQTFSVRLERRPRLQGWRTVGTDTEPTTGLGNRRQYLISSLKPTSDHVRMFFKYVKNILY